MGAKDSLLPEHMRNHDLYGTLENPPEAKRIPSKTVHLRQYAINMANMAKPDMTETRKAFKKRVYDIISSLENARHNPPTIRIAQ